MQAKDLKFPLTIRWYGLDYSVAENDHGGLNWTVVTPGRSRGMTYEDSADRELIVDCIKRGEAVLLSAPPISSTPQCGNVVADIGGKKVELNMYKDAVGDVCIKAVSVDGEPVENGGVILAFGKGKTKVAMQLGVNADLGFTLTSHGEVVTY